LCLFRGIPRPPAGSKAIPQGGPLFRGQTRMPCGDADRGRSSSEVISLPPLARQCPWRAPIGGDRRCLPSATSVSSENYPAVEATASVPSYPGRATVTGRVEDDPAHARMRGKTGPSGGRSNPHRRRN
jgi:hypothetical protein